MNKPESKETTSGVVYRLITSICICVSMRLLISDNVTYVLSVLGVSLTLAFIGAYFEIKKPRP